MVVPLYAAVLGTGHCGVLVLWCLGISIVSISMGQPEPEHASSAGGQWLTPEHNERQQL